MEKTATSHTIESTDVKIVTICGVPVNSKKSAKNIAKILRRHGVTINELHSNSRQIEREFGRPFYVQLLAKLYSSTPPGAHSHKTTKSEDNKPQYTCEWFTVESYEVTSSQSTLHLLHSGLKYKQVIKTKLKTIPEKISCVMIEDEILIDELWWYKNCDLYKIGSEYLFEVIRSNPYGKRREYIIKDKFGHEQKVVSGDHFATGDSIVCKVTGFQRKYKHLNSLALSNPRLYENPNTTIIIKPKLSSIPASYYPNGKRPEAWFREVEGLGKYTATSAFKCSCCGRSFSARQGCKIEFRNIYFCKACADQIFKHSDKGYLRIVYTPMGNKR